MKNKIFSLVITLILTANAGFCTQTRSVAVHDLIIKFTIAMIGVFLASVVIWLILSVYNKILESKDTIDCQDEIIKAPKNKDEAIKFFIDRNKLK